jgi:hypothetical protein
MIPESIGHHKEWITACKTGSPTTCNFDYGGALTEMVLLGNVAYRAGRKLKWDPVHLKATNCPDADRDLRGGKTDFKTTIYGKKSMATGRSSGYAPLLEEIVKFFKTGKPPVPEEETIEIFAFMSAADESKAKGGAPDSLKALIERARGKYQGSSKERNDP